MYMGNCVEKAPAKELFANPLHPYTKALLSAIPIPDISMRKRELHIDKALDVADLHGSAEPRQPLRVLKYRPGMASELLIRCKYFEVYRMLINGVCQEVQR